MYHHGATYDLDTVIRHAFQAGNYQRMVLVGYSMGGNLSLKYAAEFAHDTRLPLKNVVAISTPVDLASSSSELGKPHNRIYLRRFLKKLKKKLEIKARQFPDQIDLSDFEKIKDFYEFDDRYTAPVHGFKDSHDFYARVSSLPVLDQIKVPTLILNAENDPFLPPQCYPFDLARTLDHLYLETPRFGGHVGFMSRNDWATYAERRAIEFVERGIRSKPETLTP